MDNLNNNRTSNDAFYDVVVIGGGAAGCAVSASLLKRSPSLRIAVIEPKDKHYYQPGWTLVGAGIFTPQKNERNMRDCIPQKAEWIRSSVTEFAPEQQQVILQDQSRVNYKALVVCPGLVFNWDAIKGAKETLGKNGVVSNYLFDIAPKTWEFVKKMQRGKAIFTQSPLPIKCAGAPQKAMYLSCDWWKKQQVLQDIEVEYCSAGEALFGCAPYIPALMKYVERYRAKVNFKTNLIAVDGPAGKAMFQQIDAQGNSSIIEKDFDFLHITPPQCAPDFIKNSPLSNAAGWLEVDNQTLRHPRYPNIFGMGDCISSPNSKTAAAVRKQAPVVAINLLAQLAGEPAKVEYDGYGSCPLIVERGKVVLAEYGYNGKLLPTFPPLGVEPSRLAWHLKVHMMPSIYFNLMLRGHEWLAQPAALKVAKSD